VIENKRGVELVAYTVHHGAMAEMDEFVVRRAATQLRLEIQDCGVELRAVVADQFGRGRIENLDLAFQFSKEVRRMSAHKLRYAVAYQKMPAVAGVIDAADQLLLIAENDPRPRRNGKHGSLCGHVSDVVQQQRGKA
jgi:hypothetical protein